VRLLQNKIIIGGACIVLSGVFAFGVLPGVYKEKAGTEKIIKCNTTLAPGTKIEETMLKEVEVGSFGLPENVVKDKNEIIGKYVKTTLIPDDLIVDSKISEFAGNEELERIFSEGKKLITVSLPSIAAGVGNHLKSGDIISFISYEDDKPIIHSELRNIEVYCVENDNAVNVENLDSEEDEPDRVAATITVIADDVQAQKLVNTEYSGKLHVILEKRGH